jgi:hypothetical protein
MEMVGLMKTSKLDPGRIQLRNGNVLSLEQSRKIIEDEAWSKQHMVMSAEHIVAYWTVERVFPEPAELYRELLLDL